MSKLVAIVGPTASGKSGLAMEIAKHFHGESICADSRTVYRGLDIGTAKPSRSDQAAMPHHLLDVIDPNETYSAAQFKVAANRLVTEIEDRGHLPILVGGSGLYLYGVLYDYSFTVRRDTNKQRTQLEKLTTEQLIKSLESTNPEASVNIDRTNRRRLIRAIETAGQVKTRSALRPETLIIGLRVDGEHLRQRIKDRVDQMVEAGFVQEAKLVADRYGWENGAMTSIGYRAFRDFIEGRASLEQAKTAFVTGDWQLARRQLTWFKRNPDIEWFENPTLAEGRVKEWLEG